MFIILSHPAYDNKKFKIYQDIPQRFKTRSFPPEILTKIATLNSIEFKLLSATSANTRWSGTDHEAIKLIPDCIALGANPLIVPEEVVRDFNPMPLHTVKLPQGVLITIYTQLSRLLVVHPVYDSLRAKMSTYITHRVDSLQLNEIELEQLHRLLNLETGSPLINALPLDAPDWGQRDSTPESAPAPKRVPLIDMSIYDEDGNEKEGWQEQQASEEFQQAIKEELGYDPEEIKPNFNEPIHPVFMPDSLYHGVNKAERLLRIREHDKLKQRKHRRKQAD